MGEDHKMSMWRIFDKFRLLFRYIRYFITAKNGKGHGIHSPFVYDFVVHVLDPKQYRDTGFENIEALRKELKASKQVLEVLDLGAGSKFTQTKVRAVGSIARSAAKSAKYAQLLYRLIRHYHIEHVLELGTSLGLTTRYLSLANPPHEVITIEGAPGIAAFTKSKFIAEGISNVALYAGDFNNQLEPALEKMQGSKLIFVDGNHDQVATLEYFKIISKYVGPSDIIVFDDINWSRGMEKAWEEIQKCEEVSCTIDLFFIGVVLFRKEFKEKLNFSIRF